MSKDGTRVPVFVVARRGLVRDGRHPTIVYGYGASATSTLPIFREDVVAWLQMGGVFAIANLRGGGEFGNSWYRAAIRERKQITFDDLIAISEHLVAQGWTSPTLITTSRDDERLPAWHAYKFTAALQAAQGCPSPILLSVRTSGGHGGDLEAWIESVALQFVFLSRQLDAPLALR